MTKHVHAELMLQYAQDAMTTDKPWELWEGSDNGVWLPMEGTPSWDIRLQYRRKPRTIKINGFDVPEPVREPLDIGTKYYCVIASHEDYAATIVWEGDVYDKRFLSRGLIHLTREAAELHAKALLSFTELK